MTVLVHPPPFTQNGMDSYFKYVLVIFIASPESSENKGRKHLSVEMHVNGSSF